MKREMVDYTMDDITTLIVTIRGKRVILDADIARIYGVPTRRLNEQVRRNADRFPPDFAFVLTEQEVTNLKSQIATSSAGLNRSQFVIGSTHGGRRKLPMVFTEHGAIMAANVLRSKRAIQMSVFVVRAFIRMRQMLIEQRDLAHKLAELEKELTARLDVHETAITEMMRQIRQLMAPPERFLFWISASHFTAGCSAYYVGGVSVDRISFICFNNPNSAIRIWKVLCNILR